MKAILNVFAVLATVAAIVLLREATMSRHEPAEHGTEMEVVLDASSNVADADLAELVHALFLVCQLEVSTDPVGLPTALDEDTFLLRMRPTLDITDRRQLAGCLEDAVVDRVQGKVISMERVPLSG